MAINYAKLINHKCGDQSNILHQWNTGEILVKHQWFTRASHMEFGHDPKDSVEYTEANDDTDANRDDD